MSSAGFGTGSAPYILAMPELPEVEHVRRTLAPFLVGATVLAVEVLRPDVVVVHPSQHRAAAGRAGRGLASALLAGRRIAGLYRHGKQLAIATEDDGPALIVHLGMTGRLTIEREGEAFPARQRSKKKGADDDAGLGHVHLIWQLRLPHGQRNAPAGAADARMFFRDPRRFGGVWTYPSFSAIQAERWAALGPDATRITSAQLAAALTRTKRPIKVALLDQAVLAGVGNIYADEALLAAAIHPVRPASSLGAIEVERLAASIRDVLARSIAAGGTSFRDYVDGRGRPGAFWRQLAAYGRGGEKCRFCASTLMEIRLGQRSTTFCPHCQRIPRHALLHGLSTRPIGDLPRQSTRARRSADRTGSQPR